MSQEEQPSPLLKAVIQAAESLVPPATSAETPSDFPSAVLPKAGSGVQGTSEEDEAITEISTYAISFHATARSDVGLIREGNEDNFVMVDLSDDTTVGFPRGEMRGGIKTHGAFFSVCDGMGGAAHGEVASQMAVDILKSHLLGETKTISADHSLSKRDQFATLMVNALQIAAKKIWDKAKSHRSHDGMGTTATVAALIDQILFVGQVGDSRAYVLRKGVLAQISKDQSLVNQLIEAGQITPEEAETHESSNVIWQALGTSETVMVDLTFLELKRGDRLMLCSDGLSGLVSFDKIREILSGETNAETAIEQCIHFAKEGGGHDNITCMIVDFDGFGLQEPTDDAFGYQQYPLPVEKQSQDAWVQDQGRASAEMPVYLRSGLKAINNKTSKSAPSSFAVWPWMLALLVMTVILFWILGVSKQEPPVPTPVPPPHKLSPTPPQPPPALKYGKVTVITPLQGELFVGSTSFGMVESGKTYSVDVGQKSFLIKDGDTILAGKIAQVIEGGTIQVFIKPAESF